MATLNTHKGTNLNWIAYKSGGNTFVINLLSNGDPVDITDYTFVVNITRANSSEEVLQLTEVDGITNGGEAGTLTINLSQADIEASLPGNDYWYEIAYTHSSVVAPLFQGTLTLSNKKNPGSTTTSLTPTINLGDTVVNVEVTLGGGGFDVDSLTDEQKQALANALAPYFLG